jgi:Na+-driven multidrug efflux pump
MDFITQNWSWLVTFVAFTMVVMIGISMIVTQKLEDRHKKEFEKEFGESLQPVSAKEE